VSPEFLHLMAHAIRMYDERSRLENSQRQKINKNGEIGKANRRIENMPTARPDVGILFSANSEKEEEK